MTLSFSLSNLQHPITATIDTSDSSPKLWTIRPDGRHAFRTAIPTGGQQTKSPINLDIPIQTRVRKREQYPPSMATYEIQRYQNNEWQFMYPLSMSPVLPMIPATKVHDSIFHDHRLFMLCNNSIIRWYTDDLHHFTRPIKPNEPILGDLYPLYHYGEQYSDTGKFGTRRILRSAYLNTRLEPAIDTMQFLRSQLIYPLEPLHKKGKISPLCKYISLHINDPDFIEILLASHNTVYSLPLRKQYGFFVPESDPFPILTITGGTIIQI